MTKDEALKLALNALHTKGEHHPRVYEAIAAIQTVLAQPEQEPVAWQFMNGSSFRKRRPYGFADLDSDGLPYWKPLYTTPPQQQAEPIAWDKPSASFNEWWDSYRHDNANPFDTDSFAYWAWAGWKAALRGNNT